jgi:O-antigen ligase
LVYHQGIRSGSFYGATTLAAFMVLAGAAALGLMLSSRRLPERVVWLACLGACVTAMVYTNTRASWVAFAICLAIVLVLVRKSPFVVAFAVGGVVVVATVLGALIVQRMQKLAFTKGERSLLERVQYYTVAWHIFRSHPLLGLGYGCYYELKPILVNERYIAVPFNPAAEPATVHSAYLQILVKTGLVGLSAFIAFLAGWFGRVAPAFRARRADEPAFNLFVSLTAGLIVYLFHAAFENFFQWPIMAQSFWMLLGLSLTLASSLLDGRAGNASP